LDNKAFDIIDARCNYEEAYPLYTSFNRCLYH